MLISRQTARGESRLFVPGGFSSSLRQASGCQAPDPIFVVGLPRSGSTLLEQILASHSLVDGTKELVDILAMVRRLGGKKLKNDVSLYPEILKDLSAAQLEELGREYIDRTHVSRERMRRFSSTRCQIIFSTLVLLI